MLWARRIWFAGGFVVAMIATLLIFTNDGWDAIIGLPLIGVAVIMLWNLPH
jgi:multisubunit Na+/H+ antiporter MnhC subunit